ncbi:MAG: HD-GYP domain-containing protein [Marinomonas sp.]|uniref:HD-GYP domain-containing protein n=1 Tax=unclassified Marinomonas TaxID=196814 RepID=UPI0007AF9851|nr:MULTISPECIES: HD domain-containing phosphohydrolase [unclassified Marinomonas]KZM40980.1 hypothetical protein OA92_15510 [Marinomonas sp. SBI22]KZM42821.1 hypothetical protein OA91_13715 [Marinomonas sp. SBI8L]
MKKFDVERLFGVDISFSYFDIDKIIEVLGLKTEVSYSSKVKKIAKQQGSKHRIVAIVKRQMVLDFVKPALASGLLPYDPYFYDKNIIANPKDRLYDAQERLLEVCLSVAVGKSVKSLRKLDGRYDSRDVRTRYEKGQSAFKYFRNILNDYTRDYILDFKEGRLGESGEESDAGKPIKETESDMPAYNEEAVVSEKKPEATLSLRQRSLMARAVKKTKTVSVADEIKDALPLYEEAMAILLSQEAPFKQGKAFDEKVLVELIDKLIASYDRNPSALLCVRFVRSPDTYLVKHLIGCCILAIHFAKSLKMSDAYVKAIALGGLLFDYGRFKLPEPMVNKAGKLSESEFEMFKKHISFGLRAVKASDWLVKIVYQMLEDHHEKIDGTGYPEGKIGEEISVYGKMAAIIDAYDAMTSTQSHKSPMSPAQACKRITDEAGLAFDADLTKRFVQCVGRIPIGTCVELSNGRIGFVLTLNKALTPKLVRQIYLAKQKTSMAPQDIDLEVTAGDVSIKRIVDAQLINIKMEDYLFV